MKFCERIPVKTKAVSLSGGAVAVDAEGLEVTVYAKDTDVYLKTAAAVSDAEAFVIPQGSLLTLDGGFVLSAASGEARLLYCRLL